jgi:large subunit ribosomal protein L30
MSEEPQAYAVVRIRGHIKVDVRIEDTLRMLRLTRVNHCVVVPATKQTQGMVQKAKDYITWGEIDPETLTDLISKKGRILGEKRITDSYVREKTQYPNVQSLAKAMARCEFKYKDLTDVKPIFRLHPPKGGFRTIKRAIHAGGPLGYRGKDINRFIQRSLEAERIAAEKVSKNANKK